MFYFLSKTLDFLVMPFSIGFILMLYSILTKNLRRKKKTGVAAFVILFLISNTYLVNQAFLWWEPKPADINETTQVYEVGVVLSGGLTSFSKLKADHVELGQHANRFYNAYLLYKAGKIKKILITGTSPDSWIAAGKGESRQAGQVLVKWGVPASDILIEEKARNTRENATFSAKIIQSQFSGAKVLLITSAYHMRRSLGCFEKAGVNVDYFPTDFYGVANVNKFRHFVIPSAESAEYFDLLWHEWIGYISYKIVGYC